MSTTPFMRVVTRLLAAPQFIRYAERLLPGEGEDLRQEAAFKAHRWEVAGNAPPRDIPAWLGVVLRNEALHVHSARRAKRATPAHDPALALECPAIFPVGRFEGPDQWQSRAGLASRTPGCARDVESEAVERIDREREHDRVREAVKQLDPKRKAAIVNTFYLEHLVRDEAAQGAPFGSVVSRISHAKDDIAASLASTRRVPARLRVAV